MKILIALLIIILVSDVYAVQPPLVCSDDDGDGYLLKVSGPGQCGTDDCDDSDAAVFQAVTALKSDADKDGYVTGAAAKRCVGEAVVFDGREYYSDASGTYLKTPDASGLDCDDSDANIGPCQVPEYTSLGALIGLGAVAGIFLVMRRK